jgi:dTDP-4-amino-4,6-dideoxygalactose transaminase
MSSERAKIPFNRPFRTGRETEHIERALTDMHLSYGGRYTGLCEQWLEERTGACGAILTHSCTAALEMAAILADVGPGDEVVMPSFTFVTTATAFVLRGAQPVFVDIREDTMNIDPDRVAEAITPHTKAVVAIDYAGVGCDMAELRELATAEDLVLIEDAAQGLMASQNGEALGSRGHLGTVSFHETKNVTCGEGGTLLVNDLERLERAEVIRDKGTNRKGFQRGLVDKYTWVDIGSSFGLSELAAAFLWGQLEQADEITADRLETWSRYHEAFAELERDGLLRRPVVPDSCQHNAHMYYVLLPSERERHRMIGQLADEGISAVFHYVPLHSSPAGRELGRAAAPLPITDAVSSRILRLPLWAGMDPDQVDAVIEAVSSAVGRTAKAPS